MAGGVGIVVPTAPNTESVVLAIVAVAGAFWIGWFLSARLSGRIARTAEGLAGWEGIAFRRILIGLVRYGLTGFLLLLIVQAAPFSPLATMILAAALGAAFGLLAFTAVRGAGMGWMVAFIAGCAAFVATAAGVLGGLGSLITALDNAAFTIGRRRFSLLDAVNFLIVIAVLLVVARIANRILAHSIGRIHALDVSQRTLMQKFAGIAVIVVAILVGIDLLGIDLTALTVFSGALGLAVGFGLQKTFGNLLAGLILLMDRSIKPGDVIVVGDTAGTVEKIGVRAVSVLTRDGKEHLIPNEQLMIEPVENWSFTNRNVRIHIPIGVAYSSDMALAQRLMIEAAAASPRILSDPKPSVWLKGFGDSSVDYDILAWVSDPEAGIGSVRSDILNRLWTAFADNGIEMPFPQRDIHIRTDETRAPEGKDDE